MDVKIQWQPSADTDGLLRAIVGCKQALLSYAKAKHGRDKLTVVSCDAYASDKLIDQLRSNELWTDAVDPDESDPAVPLHRQQRRVSELVADFDLFRLHRLPVLNNGTDPVRVVLTMAVPGDRDQVFYGNVGIEVST